MSFTIHFVACLVRWWSVYEFQMYRGRLVCGSGAVVVGAACGTVVVGAVSCLLLHKFYFVHFLPPNYFVVVATFLFVPSIHRKHLPVLTPLTMSGEDNDRRPLIALEPDRTLISMMEPDPKKPRLGTFTRFVYFTGSGLVALKLCFHMMMSFCTTFKALASRAYLVDCETVELPLALPEGVDPEKLPAFYKQVQQPTKMKINGDNIEWALPWHHFMGFDIGLALCRVALDKLIGDGWAAITNAFPDDVADELDVFLPYRYLACKYNAICEDAAVRVYEIIGRWVNDDLIMRTVLSKMTDEHWRILFDAAAWDEDVRGVLLGFLNDIIGSLTVEAEHLQNSLLPHLAVAGVKLALA